MMTPTSGGGGVGGFPGPQPERPKNAKARTVNRRAEVDPTNSIATIISGICKDELLTYTDRRSIGSDPYSRLQQETPANFGRLRQRGAANGRSEADPKGP